MIISITGFFILLTIIKSLYFSKKNGGADLRIRVIASRRLDTGKSPYFGKWNPANGEYLLDPNDRAGRVVNGNVVTPAMLYLVYPLSLQSYPVVRILWTLLQLGLVLITLFFLLRNKDDLVALIPACIVLAGLVSSDVMLLNIDRGQVYIIYTFFFAVMYKLYISTWKYNLFMSGFVGGLFILFRPFAGAIGLIFLLNGKKKWLLGCFAGFIVGCLLFVLPSTSLWKEYFKAMQEYNNEYTGKSKFNNDIKDYEKPAFVEGTNNLGKAQDFNISGLDPVYHYLKKIGITLTQGQSYFLYALLAFSLCFIFLRIKNNDSPPESLFFLAFLLYMLAELFVLAPRGRYNLIQWMFPLSLILLRTRFNQPSFILLITGLLLLHNFPFVFPYQAALAELVFIGVTVYYVFSTRSTNSPKYGINRT